MTTVRVIESGFFQLFPPARRVSCLLRLLFKSSCLIALLIGAISTSHAQSVGDGVEVLAVNDWGSGFIATFQYEVKPEDSPLTDWTFNINHTGSASLGNAWMSGYNGGIDSGFIGSNGQYQITNRLQGFKPTLQAGNTLTFNIQGQAGGFNASEFSITFDNHNTPAVVNTAPEAADLSQSGSEDSSILVMLFGTDVDDDPLLYSINSQPMNGVLAGTPPDLTFTPNLNFNGNDEFSYIVNDGVDDSAVATVTLMIFAVNDAPIAEAASVSTAVNTDKLIALSVNDPDGDSLQLSVGTEPSHGTLTINGFNVTYSPDTDYVGTDSFSYTANDGELDSASATIEISVVDTPPVLPPTGSLQAASNYNGFFLEDFTSTSSDVQGRLAVGGGVTVDSYGVASSLSSQPTTASLVVGGDLVYGQGKIFAGGAVVAGSIDGVNPTVISGLETGATVVGEASLPIDFVESFLSLQNTSNALSQVSPNGSVVYQFGGVYLSGDCTNDIQVFSIDGSNLLQSNHIVTECVPQSSTVVLNINGELAGFRNISLSAFDSQSTRTLYNFFEASTLEFVSVGIEGSVLAPFAHVENPRGNIDGTIIARSWNGPMELHHYPFEGDLSGIFPSANLPPLAISATYLISDTEILTFELEATDEDSSNLDFVIGVVPTIGTVEGSPPSLTYAPEAGFEGVVEIVFSATDGDLSSNPAVITITVETSNEFPVLQSSTTTTVRNTPVTIPLVGTDEDGDSLTYRLETLPTNGTTLIAGGQLIYTPDADFLGLDSFFVVANDGVDDSVPAEFSITVIEEALPPEITSTAITTVIEPNSYEYDVDATDENGGELTYSLLNSPAGATIDPLTGQIQWSAELLQYPGTSIHNLACVDTQTIVSGVQSAEIMITIDESGSMSGEQRWISEVIPLLDIYLRSSGLGDGAVNNQYGLIGYGNSAVVPRKIGIGATSGYFGSASEFVEASSQLVTNGGTEDGWLAIDFAVENYPTTSEAAKTVVLITDEDRDNTEDSITYESILAKLDNTNTSLDVIATSTFTCEDGTRAIGVINRTTGVVPTTNGDFDTCLITSLGSNSIKADYVDLALDSGGTAWNLGDLRAGGETAQVFTDAFSRFSASALSSRSVESPLSDVVVANVELTGTSLNALIRNRGVVDITGPIVVDVVDETGLIGSITHTGGLIADQEVTVEVVLESAPMSSISVTATPATTDAECFANNNTAEQYYFEVQVTDDTELTDTQSFFLSLENTNQAPQIVSTPILTAREGLPYNYTVEVTDPDIGDSVFYSLIQGPPGMEINTFSGRITYLPTGVSSGPLAVSIVATDLEGFTATQEYELTVNDTYVEPKFIAAPITEAVFGQVYTYLPVVQSDTSASLEYDLFDAPNGMTLNAATGELTWTPPEEAFRDDFNVILRVKDQFQNFDIQVFEIGVDSPNVAPILSHRQPGIATEGRGYSFTISAADANYNDTQSYSIEEGPTGFNVSDPSSAVARWSAGDVTATEVGRLTSVDNFCGVNTGYASKFEMNTEWAVSRDGGSQPLVGPLYDSNGDGILSNADTLYVTATSPIDRRIMMREAATGYLAWSVSDTEIFRSSISLFADINGDKNAEIVYLLSNGHLRARDNSGEVIWDSSTPIASATGNGGAVRAWDIDGDGDLEIFYGPSVFDHLGKLLWQFPLDETFHSNRFTGDVIVADLDNDGVSEVVFSNQVRTITGDLLYTLPQTVNDTSYTIYESYFAHGDVTGDGVADLVVSDFTNRGNYLRLLDAGNTQVWELRTSYYGSPLIGEFASAPGAEIFLRGGGILFDKLGNTLWENTTFLRSRRSATAFDVDGDGFLNVVAYGTRGLFMIDGETGNTLLDNVWSSDNSYIRNSAPTVVNVPELGGPTIFVGGFYGLGVLTSSGGVWQASNERVAYLGHGLAQTGLNGIAGEVASNPEPVPPYTADLMVQSVYAYPGGSAGDADGGAAFRGIVGNRGQGSSSGYTVKLYADSPDNEANVVFENSYETLEGDSTQTITGTLTDASLLGSELFMSVIPDDVTNDCFVENNVASAPVAVFSVTDIEGLMDRDTWAFGVIELQVVPTISFPSSTYSVNEGELLEIPVLTSDVNLTDRLTTYLTNGPHGLSLSQNTQMISWRPEFGQSGSYNVSLTVYDLRYGARSTSVRITVVPVGSNSAPQITSTPSVTSLAGALYSYAISAIDNDGDRLSYTLDIGPEGMAVNSITGQLNWNSPEPGTHPVSVRVTDQRGDFVTQDFSLVVSENTAPVISSSPGMTTVTLGSVFIYNVEASDPQGQALTYSLNQAPTGMVISAAGEVLFSPAATQLGVHSVKIEVSDTLGLSATQSFDLTVVEALISNNPPTITSQPPGGAVVGEVYVYQIVANDSDGDTLAYLLNSGPADITIDSEQGLLVWIPSTQDLGIVEIAVRADDNRGGASIQTYSLQVTDGTANNTPPTISSIPGLTAREGVEYIYSVTASDVDADPLTYSIVEAPDGVSIDSDGQVGWSQPVPGTYVVRIRVTDDLQAFVEQSWQLQVFSSDQALSANVIFEPPFVSEGELITLTVQAENAIGDATFIVTIDGTPVELDDNSQLELVATGIGSHEVVVIVTDQLGTSIITQEYFVLDGSDMGAPEVEIITPSESDIVSAPTDILATVNDQNLAAWTLELRAASASPADSLLLASGTTSAINEALALLDPTLLINGQYELTLEAEDLNGLSSNDSVFFVVEGNMKVGNFSIAFEDLSIPMSGIPITVNRIYDSRQRAENQDFGYGWSIDYQDVDIDESRPAGQDWSLNQYGTGPLGLVPEFCTEVNGDPKVTVTLPDGEVDTFTLKAVPECNPVPFLEVSIAYEAEAGTTSTLEPLNNNSGRFNVSAGVISEITETNPVDPNRYRLTTKAGFVYTINQDEGIETIVDPNGNTITYSDSGISHSGGKSINFTRDTDGRITEIEDPNGSLISYNYDANGDLSSAVDRILAATSYTYNNDHGLLTIEDPLGNTPLRNIYDNDGRLIAQEDNEGNRTEFTHNIEGRESIVTDRLGRTTFLYFDVRGNVTSEIDALGHTTTRTHDVEDNQLSEIDALGHTMRMTWDTENNQLTQTDPLGNTVSYAYNTLGYETQITDELGRVYNNTYDSVGNLLTIGDPEGNTAGNNINAQGLVTLQEDMLGNRTTFEYDSEGNKTKQTDPTGAVTTYTYDINNNQLTETLARTVAGATVSETSTSVYNARDQLTQITDALGNVTKFEYDLKGQESAQIDAKGQRTEMTYDAYGRLTQTTYPDSTVSSHTYDAEGNKLTDTDRLGRTTTYSYDALNRVVKTVYPDGAEMASAYDAAGRMTSNTDARGNVTTYEYDAANRRTAVVDSLGNRYTTVYDAAGNITSETDARDNTVSYTYNDLDQRTRVTHADSTSMQDTLDALGRRTQMTDEASVSTDYGYDELGRLIGVTDAAGNTTSYTYDEAGNKLTQSDAEGRTTSWTYDALGRINSRTLPLGQTETFQYDANGNQISHTDLNGQTHTFAYDNLNRMTSATYGDGNVHSYVYDAESNRTQSRISDTTGTRTWDYSYDNRNRLTQETKPDGSTLAYQYDAASNKTQLVVTLANGDSQSISYSYDALNRLASVTNTEGTSTYGYDEVGNRASLSYPNGASQTWTYDTRNRLTKTSIYNGNGALIQSFDYTLHPTGRRTQIAELDGRTSNYTYNDRYWLTSESITDSVNGNYSASYQYDAVGNRTQGTEAGITTGYSYDDNDRLVQQGGVFYTYDANGNTLQEDDQGTPTFYRWNSLNQMVEHTAGGVTSQYEYNSEGIRHSQTNPIMSTDYLVDSNRNYAQVLAETVGGATDVVYHFGDDLISQDRDSGTHYFHVDGLGSTRVLTDSAGSSTDSYAYAAFGEVLNQNGLTENDYLYTGEQYDEGLGQYYLRARYYDQGVGRFSRMDDWMGDVLRPISSNKYIYANTDGINWIDPTGLFGLADIMSARSAQGSLNTITRIGSRPGASSATGRRLVWDGSCFVVEIMAEAAISNAVGLYIFDDTEIGKRYVGQSRVNIVERLSRHIGDTRTTVQNITHVLPVSVANNVSDKLDDVLDGLEQFMIDELNGPGGKDTQDGNSANKRNQINYKKRSTGHLKILMDKFKICD